MDESTLELFRSLQSGPYDDAGLKRIQRHLGSQRRKLRTAGDLSTLTELVQLLEAWARAADSGRVGAVALGEAADIVERDLLQISWANELRARAVANANGQTAVVRSGTELALEIERAERELEAAATPENVERLADLYSRRGSSSDREQAAELYCTLAEVLGNPAGMSALERALVEVPAHAQARALLTQWSARPVSATDRPPTRELGHDWQDESAANHAAAVASEVQRQAALGGGEGAADQVPATGVRLGRVEVRSSNAANSLQAAAPPSAPTSLRAGFAGAPQSGSLRVGAAGAVAASVPADGAAARSLQPAARSPFAQAAPAADAASAAPDAARAASALGQALLANAARPKSKSARSLVAPLASAPAASALDAGAGAQSQVANAGGEPAPRSLTAVAGTGPALQPPSPLGSPRIQREAPASLAARLARAGSPRPPRALGSQAPAALRAALGEQANANAAPPSPEAAAAPQTPAPAQPQGGIEIRVVPPPLRSSQPPATSPAHGAVSPGVASSLSPVTVDSAATIELDIEEPPKRRSRALLWIGAGTLALGAAAAASLLVLSPSPSSTPAAGARPASSEAAPAQPAAASDPQANAQPAAAEEAARSPEPAAAVPADTATAQPEAAQVAEAASPTAAPQAQEGAAADSAAPKTQDAAASAPSAANPSATGKAKPTPWVAMNFDELKVQGGQWGPAGQRALPAAWAALQTELDQCYAAGLAKKPRLKGNLRVGFTIKTNGHVTAAKALGGNFKDAAVIRCTLDAISNQRFPKPRKQAVKLQLPLQYRRS